MLARLRTSFLTGIVVIAPVALTLWLIWSVIGWFDGFVLPFVPDAYRPEQILNTIFGYDLKLNIRGVGVVVFLVFATLVGWLAKGLIGRSFIKYAENLVNRMPVVRSFYSGIKQIAETVFAQQERSFEKACMIAKEAFSHVPEIAYENIRLDEVFRRFQVLCLEAGSIIEVSTPDSEEDNYRVEKGCLLYTSPSPRDS